VTPKRGTRRLSPVAPRRVNGKHAVDAWRLPSGKKLAEFALAAGFLAPPLFEKRPNTRERKIS
jgi:hypothetical protein